MNMLSKVFITCFQCFKNILICLLYGSSASHCFELMADKKLLLCFGRHSPCYNRQILLLLTWQALYTLSWCILSDIPSPENIVLFTSTYLSYFFAPLIGWLADVKLGRYQVIKFSALASFLASILYYFTALNGNKLSTQGNVLLYVTTFIVSFGFTGFIGAMLPFLTDQLIGANSVELSAVVRWFVWVQFLGLAISESIGYIYNEIESNTTTFYVTSTLIFAVPLAVIVISDCLCQLWLDRTHKVTNPIKLIIQVLSYTRKHRYPERRSAFTYIDEEQPTRMDYGKEKFGGPFTEEEVEDVKTVLRLIPLVICLSIGKACLEDFPIHLLSYKKNILLWNVGIETWVFPLVLIPLYQLILYRCFHKCNPSMLRCVGVGFFVCTVGFVLLLATGVWGVLISNTVERYQSCTPLDSNASVPANYVYWYWRLGPFLLYGIGKTIFDVLLLELIIAQSPDKMKGLVMGIMLAFRGSVSLISSESSHYNFTLCFDLSMTFILVLLIFIFLVLSKCYTLRERNREINIQAIVEEHYERYMDQEEEYRRENPQYFESFDLNS